MLEFLLPILVITFCYCLLFFPSWPFIQIFQRPSDSTITFNYQLIKISTTWCQCSNIHWNFISVHLLYPEVRPHLVLLVAEAASFWSQTQLLCRQSVCMVAQAGDGHGRHQDAADAGHGHQHCKHPAGAGLDSGRQGQRLPIILL